MTVHERLIEDVLNLLDCYIPHDPDRPTVWDSWRDKARDSLQDRPEIQVPVGLSEDDLSDLLWLVNNCGGELCEAADYVKQEDVKCLAQKLEYILDRIS
jgi:hypothetical protein